jgi:predicted SnoaL-like aldol condensation-catalyzing enzyme
MTDKVLSLLTAAFENPNLQKELHGAKTPETFVNVAAENGYNLTKEELAAALGKVHVVFGEVVQSMMGDLIAAAENNNGNDNNNKQALTSEKVSGTNVDLVKRLFSRGEAFDSEGFITFFTDTPVYQFGNFNVCLDKASIKQSADNFFSQIDAVYHEIKMMWEVGDLVFVEMDVLYWRKDGSMISLPCTDIFRVQGDKFSELRIFMDVNPVFDPKIPVPPSASVMTVYEGKQVLAPGTMRRHFAEHPEARERIVQGYVPKWSIAGPRWPIGEINHINQTSVVASPQQFQAVGELSQAVMAQNWEKVKSYLTDDVFYKVGSGEPRYGQQELVDFFKHTFQNIAVFTGHKVRKVWQEPDVITIEMDAFYEMVGSKEKVTISCCDIYRMRGNKVSEWRVYADMSPWGEADNKKVTLNKEKNSEVFPVIVVFQVEPSRQQELLDNIMNYGGSLMKYQPGFISSSLHKSLDGTRVINYTQWQSSKQAARNSVGSQAPEIFKTFTPDSRVYEIVQQTISQS